MRPDRIIVGEIRHKEAETLFTAMNTGHDGCMGTVHANSGRETIIRLSSPPMNVPIYNLEALDFVIIQNRIHDRRLGTIRRIVQLCEIHGALEGDARAIPIASWDAAEDKIIFEASHSKYIKKLCRFTGLNDTDIWEEINRRQKVLDKMVKAGVRELDKVKMIFREYYKKFYWLKHTGQFLTGDIDLDYNLNEIEKFFNSVKNNIFVALIPHHGSYYNWNQRILEYINNCEFWIASAGLTNNYGHPSFEIFEDIWIHNKCPIWCNEFNAIVIRGEIEWNI